MISQTLKQRELRKDEIANQIRQSNLENANDSYHVLEERYNKLQELRADAQRNKTKLDEAGKIVKKSKIRNKSDYYILINIIRSLIVKARPIEE